jgi:hypothetical protein
LFSPTRRIELPVGSRPLDPLAADRGGTTKMQGQRSSGRFLFEAAPFVQVTSASASKVRLIAYSTTERRVIDLPDGKLRLGKSELPWSEIRTLERRSDAWIVTTVSGQRYAGAVNPAKVPAGQGQSLDLAEVQRVDVAVHDAGPREVTYEIRAQNGGKTVGSLKGTWPIKGSPLRATDNLYDPRDPLAPNLEWIEIEARVDAISHLYLGREGDGRRRPGGYSGPRATPRGPPAWPWFPPSARNNRPAPACGPSPPRRRSARRPAGPLGQAPS